MRRKLVVLSLLLVATVSAAGAKTRTTHIQIKDVCFRCAYCIGGTCYNCERVVCLT
jgi:hypothetical protein